MEILISVLLISVVALSAIRLQQENRNMALYLTERNKAELGNTLFLGKEAVYYDKEKKDAYTLLEKNFRIEEFKSREILKKRFRTITISEPLRLAEEDMLPIQINEIMLKGQYSARYLLIQNK